MEYIVLDGLQWSSDGLLVPAQRLSQMVLASSRWSSGVPAVWDVLCGERRSRMVQCGPIRPLTTFGGPVIWAPRLSVVVLGGSRWSAGVCDVLTCPGW